MTIVVIDNQDSFTFNLVSCFRRIGEAVSVVRNNEVSFRDLLAMNPTVVCFSPGPGSPSNLRTVKKLFNQLHTVIPLLGICLGHQLIGVSFGSVVLKSKNIMHGKLSKIYHSNKGIFSNVTQGFYAIRYHSLVIDKSSVPDSLVITAWTPTGEIMGIKHKVLPIEGMQFHPESIYSQHGEQLVRSFVFGVHQKLLPA
ncbi:anthranilate synthase component II [Candidatus Tremblaya phenacola]|uniref:anthranilate synthase component II n=1 Tax=Candidatus Tremblayella phenacoccinincola TaxID=1010676 RepID=UPI00190F6E86|nr:aminodeoxychorismate/anthranilate synthase component II [Candidatus Tremblaya phenacola]KAH0998346.1 Anthranilate synthase, amidotransferase component [Candidatus Tremblaya phenacola]